MTDSVFEVLSADHRAVEAVLERLTGMAEAELGSGRGLFEELVILESRHEAAEEQYFWPAVRKELELGAQLAERALAQEQQAKEVLERLEAMGPGTPGFSAQLAEFASAARQHVFFEEHEVWPELREKLSPMQAAVLGKQVDSAKRAGPTRPHSSTPPKPGLLKLGGPIVGLLDRARDKLSHRGMRG